MKDFNSYFESIPELETERLRLTAFTREDMDAYFDILRDPEVQKYLGGGVPLFDKEPHISNWLRNINDRLLKRKIVFTSKISFYTCSIRPTIQLFLQKQIP